GRVLPNIGAAGEGYAQQLLPGIIALTLMLTALQNVALPLVIEFSYTKEVEDRLLAPLSPAMVALEKVVFSTGRAIVAAVLILLLGEWILPHGLQTHGAHWWLFILLLIFGGFAVAAIGLVLGTLVPPILTYIVFAVSFRLLLSSCATFFSWQLHVCLRSLHVCTLFNSLTYVSEDMRGSFTGRPLVGSQ